MNTQRVALAVNMPVSELNPKTTDGRTQKTGSEKPSVFHSYLLPYSAAKVLTVSGSVVLVTTPSTITASLPHSTLKAHWGFSARLRALRDCSPVLKSSRLFRHMAHTGIKCGCPSGLVLPIQYVRAL